MSMSVGEPTRARARVLSASEVAWVLLLPCVLAAVVAIVVLGPALGHRLFAPGADRLWPPGWWETVGQPEPAKQGRYLLATLAPLLFAVAILVGCHRSLQLRSSLVRPIVVIGYAIPLAALSVALLRQHLMSANDSPSPALVRASAVAAAAAVVVIALVAMRNGRVASRIAGLARETTARRQAAASAAVVFLTLWMLPAVQTERVIGDGGGPNLSWTLNDAFAVLDGRTPLVDYHLIYAKLAPYPAALVLGAFGTTTFVYTVFMAVLNVLVLLAVYGTFRLVTRSSLFAVALLLPFVATSDVLPGTNPISRLGSPITVPAVWPMRYAGIYLVAWLTARHIAGRRPRQPGIVFFAGALAAINALEFGAGALLATAAALLCARPPSSRRAVARFAMEMIGGALAAVALVSAGTFARAGELPRLSLLLEWPRIFTNLGWFSMPLPTWGLHVAIYATFVAALGTAVVRVSQRDEGRTLTGMLAWSSVFGLFAGGYYIGRPDIYKLTSILSAWSFALTMLTIACVHALSARDWRRPTLPQLLVLFAFGLSICALSKPPLPQQEIARLTKHYPAPRYEVTAERFVRSHTQSGEAVAILIPMGYRMSHALGIRNVAPYGFMNAIVTDGAMHTLITTLQRDQVRTVFTPLPGAMLLGEGDVAEQQLQALAEIGFQRIDSGAGILVLRKA
jgi:hypothetical protein